MSKPTPTLPGMPGEIITHIADLLNDIDLSALHGTNKTLSQTSQYIYAKRLFTDVHVFLHPISFQQLQSIADNSYYADRVQNVTISTYVLRDKKYRRMGSSQHLWELEEHLVNSAGPQAIAAVLQNFRNLKSVTISDFQVGYCWIAKAMGTRGIGPSGWTELCNTLPVQRGPAVISSVYLDYDTIKWPMRVKAFESILAGIEGAKLPTDVLINLALEGNHPRPLTFPAHMSFTRALSKVSHFAANLDSFSDCENSLVWLQEVDPVTLIVNYDISTWEATDDALSFHLGTYTHLTNLKITKAKGTMEELRSVLMDNRKTLRKIELKHIYLIWEDASTYPWCEIIDILASLHGMDYLWLTNLAAFFLGDEHFNVDPRASQETPWIGEENVSRAINLLCENYQDHEDEDFNHWVNLHEVDEGMMRRYGVYQ